MYPYQQPQNYGYGYGFVNRAQAKNTQPLTAEQIAFLQNNVEPLDVRVSQTDALIAQCTHKYRDTGASSLIMDPNDPTKFRCAICGEEFHMKDYKQEDVESTVANMIDLLQCSKAFYLDSPEELVVKYYQIIPLLKKFPRIYQRSVENFAKYEGVQPQNLQSGYYGDAFTMMNNILASGYAPAGAGMYQAGPNGMPTAPMPTAPQPGMYPYPAQAGVMPGMPGMYPYPAQPGTMPPMGGAVNPFGIAGAAPAAPAPAPTAPAAPAPGAVPPAAPAATETSTQTFHA